LTGQSSPWPCRDKSHPKDLDEKGYLSPDAKRAVTVAVFARLDNERAIGGTTSTFRSAIMENVHAFANSLKEDHLTMLSNGGTMHDGMGLL